jgi:hypothetical protein
MTMKLFGIWQTLFIIGNGNVYFRTVLKYTCENLSSVINRVFEMTKSLNLKYLVVWVRSSIITEAERKNLCFNVIDVKNVFYLKEMQYLIFRNMMQKLMTPIRIQKTWCFQN